MGARSESFGFWVKGLGFEAVGFGVQGSGLRVQGFGSRILGFGGFPNQGYAAPMLENQREESVNNEIETGNPF